jgi:hypothetical protein
VRKKIYLTLFNPIFLPPAYSTTLIYFGRERDWWFTCNYPTDLTLNLLMSHICGVSKTFCEWYQKTNKTEDTNKVSLVAFKIIAILHNTRLATFIKLLETVRKGLFRNRSQNRCHTFLDCRHAAAIQEQVTGLKHMACRETGRVQPALSVG